MSLSARFNDGETFGQFEDRYRNAFENGQQSAGFALRVIQDFARYDLGPHATETTIELASYLREKIADGRINMNSSHGAPEVLENALEIMEKYGDVPKNYVAAEIDRITEAQLVQSTDHSYLVQKDM